MQMKTDRRIDLVLKSIRDEKPARIRSEIKWAEALVQEKLDERDAESALLAVEEIANPIIWRGQRSIALGDPAGWTDVLEFCWTAVAVHRTDGVLGAYAAGRIAPAISLLLAVAGRQPQLMATQENLASGLRRLRGGDREDLHLAFFASSVAELMTTGKTKASGPNGPLRKLASKLTQQLRAKDLKDACEFQLENAGTTDKDGVEFVNFQLNPVWWFAMARARKDLGLETPVPEHPLFSTPFAKLPEAITFDPKKSALLKRVNEIAKLLK